MLFMEGGLGGAIVALCKMRSQMASLENWFTCTVEAQKGSGGRMRDEKVCATKDGRAAPVLIVHLPRTGVNKNGRRTLPLL